MLPCTKMISFIEEGFEDLAEELSRAQLLTLMMAATALVLGCPFNLSQMARSWLGAKSVNAFWYVVNAAKIEFTSVEEVRLKMMQKRYAGRLRGGRFIIDDTMSHHSKVCRVIHAVFTFWDHVFGTHLKAQCIVFLYYEEDGIKFPMGWRFYYKEGKLEAGPEKERQLGSQSEYKEKYKLALELIKEAQQKGFTGKVVVADSWFCIEEFMKELRQLDLVYIFEMKENRQVQVSIPPERRIQKERGRKRQKWYELVSLAVFFNALGGEKAYGFARDLETGKAEKVLYRTQAAVVKMRAYAGKHKVVRSYDPTRQTVKYLITNALSWEAVKVITEYSVRWVIEEFFRNAKQLLDMEGACVRSKQGVALALFLVTYVDALLHFEVYRRSASKHSPSEPVTVQSIIRLAQLENVENFITIVEDTEQWMSFRDRWVAVLKKHAVRERTVRKPLVELDPSRPAQEDEMAA
jgi:SRSO17 transposase